MLESLSTVEAFLLLQPTSIPHPGSESLGEDAFANNVCLLCRNLFSATAPYYTNQPQLHGIPHGIVFLFIFSFFVYQPQKVQQPIWTGASLVIGWFQAFTRLIRFSLSHHSRDMPSRVSELVSRFMNTFHFVATQNSQILTDFQTSLFCQFDSRSVGFLHGV